MDRSAFVIQLLLSTLSIDVPLHGTDPEPKRRLFDDTEETETVPKEGSSQYEAESSPSANTQSPTPAPPSHSHSHSQPMNESSKIQNIIRPTTTSHPYPSPSPTTTQILTNRKHTAAMKMLLHQSSHGKRLQSQQK